MTDVLTADYFVTHQRKLKMLLTLAEIPLRIQQSRIRANYAFECIADDGWLFGRSCAL